MNKLYNKNFRIMGRIRICIFFSRIFTVACHAYFRLGMGYKVPHRVRAMRKTTDEIWKKCNFGFYQ